MKNRTKKFIFGIFLAIIICYANTLSAGFVWDDLNNVVNSQRIVQSEGFKQLFLSPSDGFYRPLAYLSLKLDYFFWKYNPAGYHLSNILIHCLNAVMIFLIIKKLGAGEVESFLASVLFAVHPVHTEAVAYISGRSDTVAALFILISFYLFVQFIKKPRSDKQDLNRKLLYAGSLLSFALSLLSKEIALLLPILILAYVFIVCQRTFAKKIIYSIPFFIVGITFILFRENILKGELLFPESQTIWMTNIFKIFFFYIGLLVAPFNLHMQRSLSEIALLDKMPFWLSLIVFLSFVYLIIKYTKTKIIYFAWFWFALWLFPFWGLLNYSAQIAEHWLYIPSIGLFAALGAWLSMNNKIFRIMTCAVIVIMAMLTISQNRFWQNDIRLYKYTLTFKPNDPKLNYNLGNAYLRRDMLVQAELAYLACLRLYPDYASALNNLGIVYERQGMKAAAIRLYSAAQAIEPEADYAKDNLLRFLESKEAFAQDDDLIFDHGLYQQVLDQYLDKGWVDYKSLHKNPILLDTYIAQLKQINPQDFEKFSRKEKEAIYINAYNAFTIKAIIDHYPVGSIKDIPGVWKKLKFEIAGKQYTLDQIEHGILRPEYKDARIHFALVCAAQGCPRLSPKAFSAEDMDQMLEAAGKSFLTDKTRNWLDKQNNVLYLSSIFKWFKQDFGKVPEFIKNYLDADVADFIQENNPRIKYQYNWQLNEKG